jgi:protein-S-isoprenylcysteine O-methyltransferase Ste14
MSELFFHLVFVFVFASFTVIRIVYHRRASHERGEAEFREGKLHVALRLLVGIPFMLSLVVYIFAPRLFSWAALDLPMWARWLGVGLGLASLPLIVWVQQALGSNFSTVLHVRQEHNLVTSGPYRWVRHPMYTVLFIHLAGILLLTANWYIGGVPLAAFLLIVITRMENEERLMQEKFGDAYRAYMQSTGRFLPKYRISRRVTNVT